MADRTVVVTGAHGFIGRHVARYYHQRGWTVVGMGHGDWPSSEWRSWGFSDWHSCDIHDDSLQTYGHSCRRIVHCAGSGSVGDSIRNPREDFERTVGTTLSVLGFIRNQPSKPSLVYPSSIAVYGEANTLPTPEECSLHPISPYGVHKQFAEDLCRYYGSYYAVPSTIVRLTSVYGEGLRKQLLWDACRKIQMNQLFFSGTGKETRDWLHIDDASELLYLAGQHASPQCPTINGGSGIGASVKEILSEIVSQFEGSKSPDFSSVPSPGNPEHYLANIQRARGWGWAPKVHWREGVRRYVEWYRKEIK